MPFFVLAYVSMSFWVIFQELHIMPSILASVFKSAFYGHAAIGGFAGSSILLAIQHGTARAAYSSDLGIGYDSIIQSESSTVHPEKQASLAILGVFVDNFICALSIFLVLITGFWKANPPVAISELVHFSLAHYWIHHSNRLSLRRIEVRKISCP
jgi:alanine or glycine:cation symporter, AGCS family